MRNEGGLATLTDRETGKVIAEVSTFTCFHCSRIVHVKAKQDPANVGGLCKMCMKLICPRCVGEGSCTPFLKKLDLEEARYHARRSYGF